MNEMNKNGDIRLSVKGVYNSNHTPLFNIMAESGDFLISKEDCTSCDLYAIIERTIEKMMEKRF